MILATSNVHPVYQPHEYDIYNMHDLSFCQISVLLT